MSLDLPETESLKEFARRLHFKPGYITQLKNAGRLVLAEDGRRVRVAESLQLIEETRDPAKQGVRDRHAVARGATSTAPATAGASDDGEEEDETSADGYIADPLSRRRARAQAEREEAALRKALREEAVEMGELLRRDETVPFVAQAVVEFRTQMQILPVTLGLDAETTLKLRDGIEAALEKLSRTFSSIGKGDA